MSAWLRFIRIGRLPDESRTRAQSEGVLALAESVPVVVRFSGHVPGVYSAGSITRLAGAFVLTTQHVIATLASARAVAGPVVDATWARDGGGPMTVRIADDGLHLGIPDLSRVDPGFSGSVALHFKQRLEPDVLPSLPARELEVPVADGFVEAVVGVRRRRS